MRELGRAAAPGGSVAGHAQGAVLARALHRARRLPRGSAQGLVPPGARAARCACATPAWCSCTRRREGRERRGDRAALHLGSRTSWGGNAPDGRTVRGTLHWVSAAHAVPAEVRLYDRLFSVENPGTDRGQELPRRDEPRFARARRRARGSSRTWPRRQAGRRASSSSASATSASTRTAGRAARSGTARSALKDSWAKIENKAQGKAEAGARGRRQPKRSQGEGRTPRRRPPRSRSTISARSICASGSSKPPSWSPGADKLLKLMVDLGEGRLRQIFSRPARRLSRSVGARRPEGHGRRQPEAAPDEVRPVRRDDLRRRRRRRSSRFDDAGADARAGNEDLVSPPRTRFAPSPTGFLHIGGVRTALFNWLYSRRHGGKYVLRIDDTDQQRNVEAALAPILHGFHWLGLDWDEGPEVGGPYAPYFQSQRGARYQAAVDELLAQRPRLPRLRHARGDGRRAQGGRAREAAVPVQPHAGWPPRPTPTAPASRPRGASASCA